eukprot:CAMPEP_0198672732 /NCGR_PEP_ID=MMETSP1467-20131203/92509_1 /TAXON_ID=1462469 /ORGANISM="unid. sp., Strain CCMP2135" /LENGTH=118 /DNA_ID=CAMNT_0044409575 /DNA_START=162 /DNA_END=519 /DNA_ORIENTATION=-
MVIEVKRVGGERGLGPEVLATLENDVRAIAVGLFFGLGLGVVVGVVLLARALVLRDLGFGLVSPRRVLLPEPLQFHEGELGEGLAEELVHAVAICDCDGEVGLVLGKCRPNKIVNTGR